MHATILSIGDELTLGQNLDTNSQWLSVRLAEASIITIEHRTVADDRIAIATAIGQLCLVAKILIITGGLGPTADDLTREALKDALTPHDDLVCDQSALEHLDNWFIKRGRTMPDMNRKQALRPHTMRCLPNPDGTAPGLAGTHGNCRVFSLPGPPNEMQPMFLNHVLPAIQSKESADVLLTATVAQFGMGESVAAQKLGQLMDRDRNPLVGTTVSDSIVSARVRAHGPREQIQKDLDETIDVIQRLWHPYAFGCGSQTLPEVVGSLLRNANKRLAVAESCTGGWLGKAIVDLPKSSDYFLGGWITYSNAMKTSQLGVEKQTLDSHGAVSAQVAQAMAQGALHNSGTDFSLAITGIAGPDGGTPSKPVGTVFIAVAHKKPSQPFVSSRQFHFTGDRTTIRDRSVKAALQMLRFALLNVPEDTPLLWEAASQTASETNKGMREPQGVSKAEPTIR